MAAFAHLQVQVYDSSGVHVKHPPNNVQCDAPSPSHQTDVSASQSFILDVSHTTCLKHDLHAVCKGSSGRQASMSVLRRPNVE